MTIGLSVISALDAPPTWAAIPVDAGHDRSWTHDAAAALGQGAAVRADLAAVLRDTHESVGSTTRGLPGEVGNDLATLFQRSSWEKAWQRDWAPGLPRPQGTDAFVMRAFFAETAGADELARVRAIPGAIHTDGTVTPHVEAMTQGKNTFPAAGVYSSFDLFYVQAGGKIEELKESSPHDSLRVAEYGAAR